MIKKSAKANPLSKDIIAAIMIVMLITVFVALSGVYLWQKIKTDQSEKNLEYEIQSLKTQIAINESQAGEGKIIYQADSASATEETSVYPDTELSFEKCGVAGAFVFEKWHTLFTEKLKQRGTDSKNISSACHSAVGKMVIFILQDGKYCEGPKIYRFNTETGIIEEASVLNKGVACLGPVKEFGKREGKVIKVVAPGGNNGCRREEHYDYQYNKNTVELIKSRSLCEGDKEWKWTEY